MTARRRTAPGGAARRRRQAGFTLVELLVALTLLGLLSLALLGGLRFGTRAWETAVTHGGGLDEVAFVQSFLRREVAQAIIPQRAGEAADDAPAFVGERDRLDFLAPWQQPLGRVGLYRFRLERADGLRLSWELLDAEGANTADEEDEAVRGERLLAKEVERLSLRYFGSRDQGDEPDWYDDWDQDAGLPRLIEIELEFDDPSAQPWPKLVVSLLGAVS